MTIVLAIILMIVVVWFWYFLLSFNFMLWWFFVLYPHLFQSNIINEKNLSLSSIYLENLNWTTGNYKCLNKSGIWEDNECYFRNLYGFIPPKTTIDLWNIYNDTINNQLEFVLSGDNDFVVQITDINSNKKYKDIWKNITTYLSEIGFYNIQIKNNSSNWSQFFVYFTWNSEWILPININSNWDFVLTHRFNPIYKWKKLLKTWKTYKITVDLSIADLLRYIWLSNSYENWTNKIHFFTPWFDYMWLFISDGTTLLTTWVTIWTTTTRYCDQIVKGFYWNEQENFIRPLDNNSLTTLKSLFPWEYNKLSLTWAFYTNCTWWYENFIYWQIDFTSGSLNVLSLYAWWKYDYQTNSLLWTGDLTESLEYINDWLNTKPIWLIFDSKKWLWFIGWILDSRTTMENETNSLNWGATVNSTISYIDTWYIEFISSINWFATR